MYYILRGTVEIFVVLFAEASLVNTLINLSREFLLFSMIFSFSTIRLPSLLFLLLSLFFSGHFHKEKKVRYWPEYIVYYILRSTAQAFVLLFSLFPSPSMRQPRKDGPSFRLIYSFHKRCAQKIGVKEIR